MSRTEQFYEPVERVIIEKVKGVQPEGGVRLYCTQRDAAWTLQVRGLMRLRNGRMGKDFIVASSPLYRSEMLALRSAIDEFLADDEETVGERGAQP